MGNFLNSSFKKLKTWNSLKSYVKFSKKLHGIQLKIAWNSHKNYDVKFTLKLCVIPIKIESNSLKNSVKFSLNLSEIFFQIK